MKEFEVMKEIFNIFENKRLIEKNVGLYLNMSI